MQLLADTLHRDPETVRPLAELIWQKTGGNPFFAHQFLQTLFQEDLVIFGAKNRLWEWDIARIEAMNITTNVVEFMLRKLQRLPDSTQQALCLAACIGHRFDGPTLAMIHDKTVADTFDDLLPALREGLILATGDTYTFLHDRVQQAAYTVMDDTEKIAVHLKIGRQLMARLSESERVERQFELVDHLNMGRELIEDTAEKLTVAQLNLEAGIKAKDAFTGALARKSGRFELADGGTIFLDEIGDLPLELQAKLLRALQEGEFERVGGTQTIKVDVRVIAATNRNLEQAMRDGGFREDLYYRLNVFPVTQPPLRDRHEDIPLLVRFLTKKFGTKLGKTIDVIPEAVMEALQAYPWPGNVRELENIIERGVILSPDQTLVLDELLAARRRAEAPTWHTDKLEDIEQQHILRILDDTDWRIAGPHGAADRLGLNPSTLRSRMQKLGITKRSISS